MQAEPVIGLIQRSIHHFGAKHEILPREIFYKKRI
jgi:hypothetical protein